MTNLERFIYYDENNKVIKCIHCEYENIYENESKLTYGTFPGYLRCPNCNKILQFVLRSAKYELPLEVLTRFKTLN
jgi:hypothetical protein